MIAVDGLTTENGMGESQEGGPTSATPQHFKPQAQRQVVALRGRKIGSELGMIPALQNRGIEGNCAGEVFHVLTAASRVPFRFRQREVVRFKPHEQQSAICSRERQRQAVGIVLWNSYDPDMLDVYSGFLVQH